MSSSNFLHQHPIGLPEILNFSVGYPVIAAWRFAKVVGPGEKRGYYAPNKLWLVRLAVYFSEEFPDDFLGH